MSTSRSSLIVVAGCLFLVFVCSLDAQIAWAGKRGGFQPGHQIVVLDTFVRETSARKRKSTVKLLPKKESEKIKGGGPFIRIRSVLPVG